MRRPVTGYALGSAVAVLVASLVAAGDLAAQGMWEAILAIDPQPSPYLSDWEANRSIGTLTVISGSTREETVRLVYSVIDGRGRSIASGASTPRVIPADAPTIFDSPINIEGSTRTDATVEEQLRRTGRLPEGTYEACITVADLSGFELASVCESFTLVYPDPPELISPFNGEVLESNDIFFQWTPSFVPIGVAVRYVLQVAEVRAGQVPQEALQSGVLHFVESNVDGSQLQYPLGAPPMRAGAKYAWRVQALDVNGYAVAANEGSSEVWTFRYEDGSGAVQRETVGAGAPQAMQLQIRTPTAAAVARDGTFFDFSGFRAVCATSEEWAAGAVDTVVPLPIAAALFVDDDVPVTVDWDVDSAETTSGTIETTRWAVAGQSSTRAYLVRGTCDGAPDAGGRAAVVQFVATKRLQQRFSDYVAGFFGWDRGPEDPTGSAHEGIELQFSTAILALKEAKVGGKADLKLGQEFFAENEIEVKPGLNAFGVVLLPERRLWGLLQNAGWGERKRTIQGVVSLSKSVATSFSGDFGKTTDDAKITEKREPLSLKMTFPERTVNERPFGRTPFIRTMQLAVEIAIENEASVSTDTAAAVSNTAHLVYKVSSTWELGEEGSGVSIKWAGALDAALETKPSSAPADSGGAETAPKLELVLSGKLEKEFSHAGVLQGKVWIGNVGAELHIDLLEGEEIELELQGEMGIMDESPRKVAASFTWKKGEVPDVLKGPMKELDDARAALFAAEDSAAARAKANANAELIQAGKEDVIREKARLDKASAEVIRLAKDPNTPTYDPSFSWRPSKWKLKPGSGGMTITDLIALIWSMR